MNKSSNNETNSYVLSSTVVKALDILEYLAANQPVSPAKIARELGLSRTNVHRLLATFESKGYVEKKQQEYYLSFKLFELGNSIPSSRELRTVARPYMEKLMKVVNENVYLNVMSGNNIYNIEMVQSDNHLILNAQKISTYPIDSCASGKVFMSAYDDGKLDEILDEIELPGLTEYTITDKKELVKEVKRVRAQGFGTEIMEFSLELNSIAVPIYDYRKQVVATISLSGPTSRLTEEKMLADVPVLKETAEEISIQLGR